MKVLLFGATGMVGQGVLRECLRDPEVDAVVAVGRHATAQRHEKLRDVVRADLFDLSDVIEELVACDACLFCLGVSSAGMNEKDYTGVTYDLTFAVAELLARKKPAMSFLYVSGAGTDSTEKGRSMWARVKGKTENALLALPFSSVTMFRPGFIQPMHGVTSRTRLYRAIYAVMGPLFPAWKVFFPRFVTTTENVGRAMLAVAKRGADKRVLENADINALAESIARP